MVNNNRIIKFRAWSKIGGGLMLNDVKDISEFEKTGHTIMQYTGLKDKNGVDIYEGDIVIHHKNLWEIVWDECRYRLIFRKEIEKQAKHKDHNLHVQLGPYSGYEVIGNIFENPELLN